MKVSAGRVETLVWVFVYGGLFLVAIGAALERSGSALAPYVIAAGALFVAGGAVLVWMRSRMNPSDGGQP